MSRSHLFLLFRFTALPGLLRASAITVVDSGGVFLGGSAPWAVGPGELGSLDFTAGSKLVVTVGLKGNDDYTAAEVDVTYGGQAMVLAASQHSQDPKGWTGIFYLDDPAGPGTLLVDSANTSPYSLGVSATVLTGTIGGVGASATGQGTSGALTTTSGDALVLAAYSSASSNTAIDGVDAPFSELQRGGAGSGSHAAASLQVPAPGSVTASFDAAGGSRTSFALVELLPSSPRAPSPAFGLRVVGGDQALSWTNLPPVGGSDVRVDLWFGTDPQSMAKVVDAALNETGHTVSAPDLGRYYWRVDTYTSGDAAGTPVSGTLLSFVVDDTDGDGLTDVWEQLHFGGPQAAVAAADSDGDGLSNLEEFHIETDPNDPDTDADGLFDGVETDTGTWASAADTGTDYLDPDSDDDGLLDGVETNTGQFVDATDTGTDPNDADTDGDDFSDGIESNSGTFVDAADPGTHPLLADTDGDGTGEWYEVYAVFTDPTDAADNPGLPYPLPDPGSDTGASDKPVKVYIMAGQSNMYGTGQIAGDEPGTLEYLTGARGQFPNLLGPGGGWSTRQDVRYRGLVNGVKAGPLTPGQGGSDRDTSIGPELGFGWVMGWHHDEPVLLLKTSWPGRSLGWNFLPPGSPRFQAGSRTFAGYGDSPASWTTGTTPQPTDDYAGRHYDWLFLDEADYAPGSQLAPDINPTDILDNFATEYPQWADQGFEIAGFVWWQAWNDGRLDGEVYSNRYEQNLVRLIEELRDYYGNRYPGNIRPDTPFVVGTAGFGGWSLSGYHLNIANAQLAVDGDAGNYPAFADNVKTVETRGYARDYGPVGNEIFHYYQNAETYLLVGDALGRAMLELQDDESPPSPNPSSFQIEPGPAASGSVGMVATTAEDPSGPVEYYFENLTNAANSGWVDDPAWTETGLTDGVSYTYRVKTRDALGNEGEWSPEVAAVAGSDVTAPDPDPLTWQTEPTALGETSITMAATTALDINGVEYFFEAVAGGGNDSGWQASPSYTDSGLATDTTYAYRVKARDGSPARNETAWSPAVSVTPTVPDSVQVLGAGFDLNNDDSPVTDAELENLDLTDASKLVVTVGVKGSNLAPDNQAGTVTYNGTAMTLAVGSGPSPSSGSAWGWVGVYYLDDPAAVGPGPVVVEDPGYSLAVSAVVLAGTAPGAGAVSSSVTRDFVNLDVSAGSVVVAGSADGGSAENAAVAPLVEIGSGNFGSGGHVHAYQAVAAAGPYTATFLVPGSRPSTVGAEFPAALAPSTNRYADWIAAQPGVDGRTGTEDDPDGDGIANAIENIFGTAPGSFSTGLLATGVDPATGAFSFTHPLNPSPADDLSASYHWSTDLSEFYNDGQANAAGTTTVSFGDPQPVGDLVEVAASVSGPVIPDRLFVRIEVAN